MKLRRQIAGRAVVAKRHAVCFITLRELHNLVKLLPIAVKGEFQLHIGDLVRSDHLTLQHLDLLILYEKLPH